MVGSHPDQRLAILCDADNLEILDGERRWIDWGQLLKRMNGRKLGRAIYFRPDKTLKPEVQERVEAAGFEVRRTFRNSDAWIAAEAFALSKKFDVIAFVGGDGDLEPIILMLRTLGVRVEVWSWSEKTSRRVRDVADAFVALQQDLLR